ncbi:hypothetical protein ACYZTL_26430 [Pseudomonas sp. LB3P81]
MRSVLVHFFWREQTREDKAVKWPPGMRAWNSRKNGSLCHQAERTPALGGPWKLEFKANFLNNPFTLQKNEMIDMVCSLGKISAPCVAKELTGFRRTVTSMNKTKVAE